MGGTSTTQQTQNSTTNPWEPAQPMLQNILGQLNGQLGNTGVNANENNALNTLSSNAAGGNPYASQIGSFATKLLNGGGATDQSGMINDAYKTYQAQTNPLASNTNYDPMQTPGLAQQLQTIRDDVGNSINSQFAAAGRDFSGANQQAYGRGVTQGLAPVITAQYNQNIQNQQGAAQGLFNAGNTTAGTLSNMQQNYLSNQGAGINAASSALDANNYGANQQLAIEAQRRGIPASALGLLAQIGIPIAGLGGQSTGTSSGSSTMSGAQQFATIANGIGSLWPKAPIKFGS